MKALLAPLEELGEYEEIKKMLEKERAAVTVSGCVDSEKLHMIYGLGDGFRHKIIVTFSDLKAKELYEDYQFYTITGLTSAATALHCSTILPDKREALQTLTGLKLQNNTINKNYKNKIRL